MGARTWNEAEDKALFEGRSNGLSFEDIAVSIGRTPKACRARFEKAGAGYASERQAAKEIRTATGMLGEAIKGLLGRMDSNDVAVLLGTPPIVIPGTERIYSGQAAERLAA